MSGSILVVTFDTSTGIRTGRLVGSTLLEDEAVISGKLGSGVIGAIHFAPFSSGMVVVGQDAGVTPVYGFPPAGVPGDESITSAKLASGAVIGDRIANLGIFSGKLASGAVGGSELLEKAIITSAKIAASVIATPHILNQGILSASLGIAVIGKEHIADSQIVSAKIGTGAVGGVLIQDAGVLSGKVAAAAVGGDRIWSFGVLSGRYSSGSITEQALVSGISIDIAETVEDPGYRASEAISSFCCVFIASMSGNYVSIAKALSGSMPAIGITAIAIASNALGVIKYGGRAAAPTAVVSGQYGKPVFVGSDGQLKITPPSTSGYCQQIMGTVKDDDEIMLFPEPGYIELT